MSGGQNGDDEQRRAGQEQTRDGDRNLMGALGGSRQCPNCGSFSYREFFDAEGKAMCQCNDCDTVFPAGAGA